MKSIYKDLNLNTFSPRTPLSKVKNSTLQRSFSPFPSVTIDSTYSLSSSEVVLAFRELQHRAKQLSQDIEECEKINDKYRFQLRKKELSEYEELNSFRESNHETREQLILSTRSILLENERLQAKMQLVENTNKAMSESIEMNTKRQMELESHIDAIMIKIKEKTTQIQDISQSTRDSNQYYNHMIENSLYYDNTITLKSNIHDMSKRLQEIRQQLYTYQNNTVDLDSHMKTQQVKLNTLEIQNTELLNQLLQQRSIMLQLQTQRAVSDLDKYQYITSRDPNIENMTSSPYIHSIYNPFNTQQQRRSSKEYSNVYTTQPNTIKQKKKKKHVNDATTSPINYTVFNHTTASDIPTTTSNHDIYTNTTHHNTKKKTTVMRTSTDKNHSSTNTNTTTTGTHQIGHEFMTAAEWELYTTLRAKLLSSSSSSTSALSRPPRSSSSPLNTLRRSVSGNGTNYTQKITKNKLSHRIHTQDNDVLNSVKSLDALKDNRIDTRLHTNVTKISSTPLSTNCIKKKAIIRTDIPKKIQSFDYTPHIHKQDMNYTAPLPYHIYTNNTMYDTPIVVPDNNSVNHMHIHVHNKPHDNNISTNHIHLDNQLYNSSIVNNTEKIVTEDVIKQALTMTHDNIDVYVLPTPIENKSDTNVIQTHSIQKEQSTHNNNSFILQDNTNWMDMDINLNNISGITSYYEPASTNIPIKIQNTSINPNKDINSNNNNSMNIKSYLSLPDNSNDVSHSVQENNHLISNPHIHVYKQSDINSSVYEYNQKHVHENEVHVSTESNMPVENIYSWTFLPTSSNPSISKEFNIIAKQSISSPVNQRNFHTNII